MSRQTQALDPQWLQRELTREEAQAQAQAADCYALMQAQDVLRAVWRQGRLTSFAFEEGMAALCATLHAIENPGIKQINLEWGDRLAKAQAQREREDKHVNF